MLTFDANRFTAFRLDPAGTAHDTFGPLPSGDSANTPCISTLRALSGPSVKATNCNEGSTNPFPPIGMALAMTIPGGGSLLRRSWPRGHE
jgi:hypothetical protein